MEMGSELSKTWHRFPERVLVSLQMQLVVGCGLFLRKWSQAKGQMARNILIEKCRTTSIRMMKAMMTEQKSCQLGACQYKHPIAIHAGKPKNGLKEALRAGIGKIKRLSLSETTLEKATKSYGIDLVRFTQKNILRVYPKWTRVTSSNFNPLTGWMHEAQMVAFNLQVTSKKSATPRCVLCRQQGCRQS